MMCHFGFINLLDHGLRLFLFEVMKIVMVLLIQWRYCYIIFVLSLSKTVNVGI